MTEDEHRMRMLKVLKMYDANYGLYSIAECEEILSLQELIAEQQMTEEEIKAMQKRNTTAEV